MAARITITDDDRQRFETNLGGQPVAITVWWQPSTEGWYLSVENDDGTPIATGLRLVTDSRLLRGFVTDFQGDFVLTGNGEPGRAAWLFNTHRLFWIAPDDLAP